jgi:hypothetical protein
MSISITKLEKISNEQQEALENDIEIISEKGKTVAINALFIVGGLALSYLLFKAIAGEDKSKNKKIKGDQESVKKENVESSSFVNEIAQTLGREAAIIFLELAREKLSNYLKKEIDK